MNVQISGPVAAIIIAAMTLLSLVWLALVLTHTITFDTGIQLISHAAIFILGSFTPMVVLRRTGNGLSFSISRSTSVPPPAPATGENKPS